MMETILLVDDDPAIRELFAIYLEMGGFRPLTVAGGKECLDLLGQENPDLIILDMMMEPMDGWDTLRAVLDARLSRHPPILVLTGKPPVTDEILRYGGMIWDYIVKPVDVKQIVSSLAAIITRDHELQEAMTAAYSSGKDRSAVQEYARLLRLVTVARNLEARRRERPWTDTIQVNALKERLTALHTRLGFSDRLLESA
ncbi:MAG: two-component system response regulator [Methanomicrobiales archaeon HGW-Methanomicrobiales-3]|jgi:DNA-binding response OmpR family regulator|nr:MAG: two-component system response regulator [Methanomicrobiales archaeon HGW-Methanomicrobiales-3]